MLENRAISEKRTVNENSLSGPPNPIELGENSEVFFFMEVWSLCTFRLRDRHAFVLETSFRVQHKGEFSGGVATIQCMYAPEFTAHSSADKMRCAK